MMSPSTAEGTYVPMFPKEYLVSIAVLRPVRFPINPIMPPKMARMTSAMMMAAIALPRVKPCPTIPPAMIVANWKVQQVHITVNDRPSLRASIGTCSMS